MKLFWKIFFTVMIISALCVTVSSCVLIDSAFHSQLESEVQTAQYLGEIVFFSLQTSLQGGYPYPAADSLSSDVSPSDIAHTVAQSISIDNQSQKIAFGIVDSGGSAVFSSLPVSLDKSMTDSLDGVNTGQRILPSGDGIFVQILRPMSLYGDVFYIETLRDVTAVFETQKNSFAMMIKIMLALVLIVGGVAFLISKLLLRQVTALSQTAKTLAGGDLAVRARVRGQDETAALARNFNLMADRLEAQMQELRDESARKELFVAAFSHELRTPLTSIIGYSDLLRQGRMQDAEAQRSCAEYIFSEGKRLESLSSRLLELIVLKNRSIERVPAEIDILLRRAYCLCAPQLEHDGISLALSASPAVIPMDEALMETVFINLIDNARKASCGGKISVIGEMQEDLYTVTVRDSGRGMEERELLKITDAFYRVDKSRHSKKGGAGLGLAICKAILDLHGFSISFSSVPNVVTEVQVAMPVKEEDYAQD